MPQVNYFVYGVIRTVLYRVYRILFGFRFFGAENVPLPSDGRGVLLAPNHASFLDPPVLGISLKRHVTYLAKEYLFRALFIGWVLRSVGALPIKTRDDDFRSLRQLMRTLKSGNCVVVFPEGTRSPDGGLKEAEEGIGFLAARSNAYVVPVYIQGTYEALPRGARWFRRQPVKVFYGEGFIPAEDTSLMGEANPYKAVSQKIMSEIARLKESAEVKRFPAKTR